METALEDLFHFINAALDGMVAICAELGDELVNAKPDVPGANSPFAILTHCLGVMNYWGGQIVAGRAIERDRPAEFHAHGRVGELTPQVYEAKTQLRTDLLGGGLDSPAETQPRMPLGPTRDRFLNSTAIVHMLVELAQHRGHMEITRDLLLNKPSVEE